MNGVGGGGKGIPRDNSSNKTNPSKKNSTATGKTSVGKSIKASNPRNDKKLLTSTDTKINSTDPKKSRINSANIKKETKTKGVTTRETQTEAVNTDQLQELLGNKDKSMTTQATQTDTVGADQLQKHILSVGKSLALESETEMALAMTADAKDKDDDSKLAPSPPPPPPPPPPPAPPLGPKPLDQKKDSPMVAFVNQAIKDAGLDIEGLYIQTPRISGSVNKLNTVADREMLFSTKKVGDFIAKFARNQAPSVLRKQAISDSNRQSQNTVLSERQIGMVSIIFTGIEKEYSKFDDFIADVNELKLSKEVLSGQIKQLSKYCLDAAQVEKLESQQKEGRLSLSKFEERLFKFSSKVVNPKLKINLLARKDDIEQVKNQVSNLSQAISNAAVMIEESKSLEGLYDGISHLYEVMGTLSSGNSSIQPKAIKLDLIASSFSTIKSNDKKTSMLQSMVELIDTEEKYQHVAKLASSLPDFNQITKQGNNIKSLETAIEIYSQSIQEISSTIDKMKKEGTEEGDKEVTLLTEYKEKLQNEYNALKENISQARGALDKVYKKYAFQGKDEDTERFFLAVEGLKDAYIKARKDNMEMIGRSAVEDKGDTTDAVSSLDERENALGNKSNAFYKETADGGDEAILSMDLEVDSKEVSDSHWVSQFANDDDTDDDW
ncbi:MAG: hypothetical protein PUP46_10970 [Endozoicomonas sp. (ex Botrylloides leachii)]|nr:hypothetical protein [Endozoicomonas sp. (ex Botrylloides leachii)]